MLKTIQANYFVKLEALISNHISLFSKISVCLQIFLKSDKRGFVNLGEIAQAMLGSD